MTKEGNKLLHYVMRRYCPHDIVQRDYVLAFTQEYCDYAHKAYDDPCAVCWDMFLIECFDEEDL